MKVFVAMILAVITAATTAFATESRTLSKHGVWVVDVNIEDDGELWCDMWTYNLRGGVHIILNRDRSYEMMFHLSGTSNDNLPETIDLRVIVNNVTWTLRDANMFPTDETDATIFFRFVDWKAKDMVNDIVRGREIRIPVGTGYPDYAWSLKGSSAAMRDLQDCGRKITENY